MTDDMKENVWKMVTSFYGGEISLERLASDIVGLADSEYNRGVDVGLSLGGLLNV